MPTQKKKKEIHERPFLKGMNYLLNLKKIIIKSFITWNRNRILLIFITWNLESKEALLEHELLNATGLHHNSFYKAICRGNIC